MNRPRKWSNTLPLASFTKERLQQLVLGVADQGLSVGGTFLVNVALARTGTKEEYGTFALCYSIFTFFSGLQNATVLEPFTVYASGRYQERFGTYARLMMRSNAVAGGGLCAGLLIICFAFSIAAPTLYSPSLLGLAIAVPFIFAGTFLRRGFYVIRRPAMAANTSLVFFLSVVALLWLAARFDRLNGFSVFLILALAWLIAGLIFFRKLPSGEKQSSFLDFEPHYWREHWAYSRWVLATAFVFQFMHQGYYWLVAGFLSVTEVGELKAAYVLIAPIEQVMISISLLFLPILAAKYASKNMGAFVSFWKRYLLLMTGILLLFAGAVRAVGSKAIHILYAGRFDELAPMLFLLALVPLLTGLGSTMADALRAAEKPRLVFHAYVTSALATVLIGVPMVKYFGLRGAVYGMVLSAGAYAAALALAFRVNVPKTISSAVVEMYSQAPPLPASEEML